MTVAPVSAVPVTRGLVVVPGETGDVPVTVGVAVGGGVWLMLTSSTSIRAVPKKLLAKAKRRVWLPPLAYAETLIVCWL